MTDPARDAIVALAAATPVAPGLWIFGRWRAGDLRPRRDALVIGGTLAWAVILGVAFAGPLPATLLVPPIGLLLGGSALWVSSPQNRPMRVGAVLAVALGAVGLVAGALRLLL